MIKKGLLNGAKTIYTECNKKSNQRCFESTTTKVLLLILANLIERAKTVMKLTEMGRIDSIGILTRSYFELFVYLDYILLKETDKRAKCFFLSYQISLLEKMIKLGEFNPEYLNFPEEAYDLFELEAPGARSVEDLINHYRKEHEQLYDNPKGHSQKWYNLHGEKRKFQELMESMNYTEDLYWIIYGIGSLEVHGSGSLGSMVRNNDSFYIESFMPVELCHRVITECLHSSSAKIAKHFGISKMSTVEIGLKQMGTSSTGGNFKLK